MLWKRKEKVYLWRSRCKGEVTIKGAIRNGVDEKSANKIYDLMIDFAKLCF